MKKQAATGLLIAAALPAAATPEYWAAFKGHYALQPDWPNAKAKCANCHTEVPTNNAFGTQVRLTLASANSKDLTGPVLARLEALTLPGDTWTVGSEIRAGLVPGDVKSHPASTTKLASQTGTPKDSAPLVPRHSFHPALVHFPIALFVFGAVLEMVGARTDNKGLRSAACWNLAGAAASSLLAVPTGFAALLRFGFPFAGTALWHLVLALSSSFLMAGFAIARFKRPLNGPVYWSALLVTLALLAAAGHLGGTLVGI